MAVEVLARATLASMAQEDNAVWPWAVGGLAVLAASVAYASYRAAPKLIKQHAPELLPAYQRFQKAGSLRSKIGHATNMLEHLASGSTGSALPGTPYKGRIEDWYFDLGAFGLAAPELKGHLYDSPLGHPDGEAIVITEPKLERIGGKRFAMTPRSSYELGEHAPVQA